MHIKIYAYGVVGVSVMTLRCEYQDTGEFRIAVECSDTLQHIAVKDLKGLAGNNKFAAGEAGSAGREFLVDDLIEFARIAEGET